MLEELHIKNFAIIDELKVAFSGGLNMITGETGAGKSIIIGAVSLILGDRASADLIRTSEDSATVEALFAIDGNETLKKKLLELGIDPADELVIKRTLSRSGKNRIHINGQPATLNILASLSEALINVCGQHEHQTLLDSGRHIDILDEFGGLLPVRSDFKTVYDECLALQSRLDALKRLADNKAQAEAYLRFQLKEIEDAAPLDGEDIALADEKKIIRNAALLQEQATGCYDALYAREGSILAELGNVISKIREIKKIDGGFTISPQDLDSLLVTLEETALTLRDYLKKISFDPDRLDEIEDRLELLSKLKRKFGGSLGEVLKKQADIRRELEGFASADEEMADISKRLASIAETLAEKAAALSRQRQEAARKLKFAVEQEIRQLKMEHARFEVIFRARPTGQDHQPLAGMDPKGMDDIEFYLSPNVGEDIKPLNRIASGGELSRIVLAMKKVLAGTGSVGTIIFDEVDSGIGGAVAETVGEKLRDVAQSHQIICITHLPQIACFGDSHYVVSKRVSGERTNTQISPLAASERPDEIARMLGGINITEKTRAHAREMLKKTERGQPRLC